MIGTEFAIFLVGSGLFLFGVYIYNLGKCLIESDEENRDEYGDLIPNSCSPWTGVRR